MLSKKEYSAILSKALSDVQVIGLFREKFPLAPAIRLVKTEYKQNGTGVNGRMHSYRIYYFSCDRCGERFRVQTESYSVESKEECTCPKCGHSIDVKGRYGGATQHYISDSRNFQFLYTPEKGQVIPCCVTYEKTMVDEKTYYVIRRFHFDSSDGEIQNIRTYRCAIVPVESTDNYALLYENDYGELKRTRTENAETWFEHSRYDEISLGNEIVCKSAAGDVVLHDRFYKTFDRFKIIIDKASKYFSADACSVRAILSNYPVGTADFELTNGYKRTIEVFDEYFVIRQFAARAGKPDERVRYIYCPKDKANVLIEKQGEEWLRGSALQCPAVDDEAFIELKNELSESLVGDVGLFDYIEDGVDLFNKNSHRAIYYLQNLYHHPIIETLSKIGFVQLVSGVIESRVKINPAGKKIWQKLCLSKSNYQLALEKKYHPDEMAILQNLNDYDEHIDGKAFDRYLEANLNSEIHDISSVFQMTKLSLSEIVSYLDTIYYEQGCEARDSVGLWRDYLGMYKQCFGHTPKKPEELFPESLKKAHDVLSMQSDRWCDKYSTEGKAFTEIRKKWEHLEYENKDFLIRIPKNSREVVIEGKELSHCVGSYVRRIVDGECLILFIRQKGEPNKPFFTMEYDLQSEIRQIKGRANQQIKDISERFKDVRNGLISFLFLWGKKNGIDVGIKTQAEEAA